MKNMTINLVQHLEATISSIDFEMAGYQKWFVRNINDVTPDSILFGESLYHRIEDTNKEFRKDIKFYKKLEADYHDRRPDKTEETLIPIGSEVCVFGTYVAAQKAIVPGRWRSMRMISGDRSKVLESMRMNYWAWFFLGLILISLKWEAYYTLLARPNRLNFKFQCSSNKSAPASDSMYCNDSIGITDRNHCDILF